MKNLSHENIKIKDGFWKFYNDLNRNSVLWNVYDRFLETGRFDALRCDWKEGEENRPHMFWDSDVAKWIEGASYIIGEYPDERLLALVDEMIANIEKNQREDGYFNSYFLTVEPEKIFKCRDNHEIYCVGHMIEAAIAYHKATGKDTLLNCVRKNIDCICKVFVTEKSAGFTTPGHEEIELALLKLYDYLGEKKYLELARFFINERGANEKDLADLLFDPTYYQSDVPVREITEAAGHSVRGGYLYTAMAMLAKADGDTALLDACHRIFDDIVNCKMSITGGIGAEHEGERFSYKYNLPNRDTYNETCAAASLAMFAGAMQEAEADSRYGDVIERVFYNGFISGVSLDGEKFFYTNPLEIDLKKYAHSTHQCNSGREKMFYCSCCPPNVVRMLSSSQRYAYTVDENRIYCNQFMSCRASLEIGGKAAKLTQTTDYPFSGKIRFDYTGEPATLFVRIPDWCVEYEGEREKGYARFEVSDGDTVSIDLPMEIHFMESNPAVQDNAGRYAVQYGPLVYCLEGVDNGENLRDITLLERGMTRIEKEDGIPAPIIYMGAFRRKATDKLYSLKSRNRNYFAARLIPYFSFANRGDTDMLVWTMVE